MCVFSLLWRLGTTYAVHLRLIEKRVVDFLLVLIELFSLGVTAEELRAKIYRKSAISLQRRQFDPKFHVEGVADFLQAKCEFTRKTAVLHFEPSLGLRDNVR